MSIEKMKEQMAADVIQVRLALMEARLRLNAATDKVAELEREELALQAALDVLEGKAHIGVAVSKRIDQIHEKLVAKEIEFSPECAIINGEPVVLEQGLRVGKNSFGEDCLLPVEAGDPIQMAEPTKPDNKALILPPVSADESFSAPESQL